MYKKKLYKCVNVQKKIVQMYECTKKTFHYQEAVEYLQEEEIKYIKLNFE